MQTLPKASKASRFVVLKAVTKKEEMDKFDEEDQNNRYPFISHLISEMDDGRWMNVIYVHYISSSVLYTAYKLH